jgi:hypothetical protein
MSPCDGEDENVEHQGHRRGSITSGFLWRMGNDRADRAGAVPDIDGDDVRLSTTLARAVVYCTPSPQHVSQAMGDIHSPLAYLNRRCEGKE